MTTPQKAVRTAFQQMSVCESVCIIENLCVRVWVHVCVFDISVGGEFHLRRKLSQ